VSRRAPSDVAARVAALDWDELGRSLDAAGHALTPPILTGPECAALVRM
jgi:hypothetical protein